MDAQHLINITKYLLLLISTEFLIILSASCQTKDTCSANIPFTLDHNRMLIEAEIMGNNNSWYHAKLWVDSGNPDFYMSPEFAGQLGIDVVNVKKKSIDGKVEIDPPNGVRINGLELNFEDVVSYVVFDPFWLFSTMKNDANLPSTVLNKYQVYLDYPALKLTIAKQGNIACTGDSIKAIIHPKTGIIQIPVLINGDSMNFALDNGASCSFISDKTHDKFLSKHPDLHYITGAAGCANMWGWFPAEEKWQINRIQEIKLGTETINGILTVCLPESFPLIEWYSRKTVSPVDGFLGANFFKAFRVCIDYHNSLVYFEKNEKFDPEDMNLVGLTIRPEKDGNYRVIGIPEIDGTPVLNSIQIGDIIIQIEDLEVKGQSMGRIIDALRGVTGDIRRLVIQRNSEKIILEVKVGHLI